MSLKQLETFDFRFRALRISGSEVMRHRSRIMNSSKILRPGPELFVITSVS